MNLCILFAGILSFGISDRQTRNFIISILVGYFSVNPNDLTGGTRKKLDLHLDVNFDGIDISLLQKGEEFVHTGVTGKFAILNNNYVILVGLNLANSKLVIVCIGYFGGFKFS